MARGAFDLVHEHLFKGDTRPLDFEVVSIKRLVSELEARIDTLEAQIHERRPALDLKLMAERDKLFFQARLYKAVIAPVRRLPPELVCEIFSRVPRKTRTLLDETIIPEPPWRLGHICRSWRQIALTYPSLWNSFTLIQAPYLSHYFPRAMIETQLIHAGHAPLHINFDWREEDTQSSFPWDLFLPLCHRWASLRIQLPDIQSAEVFLKSLQVTKGNLPQLEKIEFLIDCDEPWPLQWDLFTTAPRLRDVLITNLGFERYSPQFSIPWAQITRYSGVFSAVQQFDILCSATNLVECSISFDAFHSNLGDVVVELPLLRKLRVEVSGILAHIVAPALENLLVCDAGVEDSTAADAVANFIRRSSCRLRMLVFTAHSPAEAVVSLLTLFASLEHLVVDGICEEDVASLCAVFTAMQSNSNVCPNLRSIALGWYDDQHDWGTAFFRMVQSRPRLHHVRLFCADLDGDLVPERLKEGIQNLEDDGFDVKFLNAQDGEDFLEQLWPQ
ncbi:hypothetical protein FB45DRAFT_848046 [Roridomyces roridus]|uniref:F-box domain-containing protein n=1 Tax=Roridomyces roridus TaxID=1738132 RepID=A0AAD7B0F8_9AGAR|nr:hypothetical protein FB45DRAFT_848046 [Roridomyces roridus]